MRRHRHLDQVGPLSLAVHRSRSRLARIAITVLSVWLGTAVPWSAQQSSPTDPLVTRSKGAATAVALVCLLPILNFFGWWDSYFSFSLYSGSQPTADIYVSEVFKDRLPTRLSRFVRVVRPSYNPAFQTPYLFDYTSWSLAELGAPGLPEPRAYRAIFRHLNGYAGSPNELHMVLAPRCGPILLCRGEATWPLASTPP